MSRKSIALILVVTVVILSAFAVAVLRLRTPALRVTGPLRIGHSGEVSCLEYTPDGKYLASGSKGFAGQFWEGEIKVIDVNARKVVNSARQEQWVDSISISPDGQRLALALSSVNNTGVKDGHGFKFENSMLVVCELPSLKEIRKSVFDCPIEHVKFSPDGKLIGFVKRKYQGDLKDNVNINLFNSWDLTLVDSETLEERRSFSDFCWPIGFAFMKDSKRVVLGSKVRSRLKSEEQVFASYDIQTGDKIAVVNINRGPAMHIQATADEQLFLIFDAYEGARLLTFPGGEERTDPPFTLATRSASGPACLSSDLRYILRNQYRHGRLPSAHLWDLKESREVFRYEDKTGTYTARAFSPLGNQFALGTARGYNHELGKVLIFDIP